MDRPPPPWLNPEARPAVWFASTEGMLEVWHATHHHGNHGVLSSPWSPCTEQGLKRCCRWSRGPSLLARGGPWARRALCSSCLQEKAGWEFIYIKLHSLKSGTKVWQQMPGSPLTHPSGAERGLRPSDQSAEEGGHFLAHDLGWNGCPPPRAAGTEPKGLLLGEATPWPCPYCTLHGDLTPLHTLTLVPMAPSELTSLRQSEDHVCSSALSRVCQTADP